ncbi:uncharacterized protein LOC132758143 [Ruditapes philippinarum]|uniref:uncharacterized protein LOC132758143 n=1 Tax=Ruditapes philippinarum TaxID=129788 RepID=UPI00295B4E4B|nr:uncharacterized protein LOC132758143 [Ruditapes philippinarum]
MHCPETKWKLAFFFLLACFVILIQMTSRPLFKDLSFIRVEPRPKQIDNKRSSVNQASFAVFQRKFPNDEDINDLLKAGTREKVTSLAKYLRKAQNHVRGFKTSHYLQKSISIMNAILKEMDIDVGKLYERSNVNSTSVCSETFMGSGFGYPWYREGFKKNDCDYSVPMSNLVTVVKYIKVNSSDIESSIVKLKTIISTYNEVIANGNILIAVDSTILKTDFAPKYKHLKLLQSKYKSEGSALNKLIEEVKTPYVLVARDVNNFTSDIRLQRLVGEIESLTVVAAGGAFREPNGHWRKGCFQSIYQNYTLKYMEGYDESFHECLFCDYIQGPFVTTTEYLSKNLFHDLDENNGLYEDWFLRVSLNGQETITCPDSMFHVDMQNKSSVSNLVKFAQKWDVFEIYTPTGITYRRSCGISKPSSRPSRALSPCTLKVNNEAAKVFMRVCESTRSICELQASSTLGAVKLGKALPWEYDWDVRVLATNITQCKVIIPALQKAGFRFKSFEKECGKSDLDRGVFHRSISYRGYNGDLHGILLMSSAELIKSGLAPTKVLLDGQWVNVPGNPGMSLRHQYGQELYQHAEHWRYTKNNIYETNKFLPCTRKGSQDCLDNFNADGDLQFAGMLP